MFCELITRIEGNKVWTRSLQYNTLCENLEVDKVYLLTTDGLTIIDAKEQPFEIIEGRLHQLKIFGDTCHFYIGDRHLIAMNENYQNGNQYKLWVVGKTVYKSIKQVI